MTGISLPAPKDTNPFQNHFKFRFIALYFLAITMALGAVLATIPALNPEQHPELLPQILIVFNCAAMVLLCLLLAAKMVGSGMYVRDLIGGLSPNRSWWLLVLVLPALLFSLGTGQLYFYLMVQLFPEQALQVIEGGVEIPSSQSPVWEAAISAIAIAVVAPLAEEFLFRGILLHRWATKMGVLPGILASSVLFGILHPNPIGLTMFGLVTALIYVRTHSLWLVTAFHAMNNGIVGGLGLLSSQAAAPSAETIMTQMQSGLLSGGVLVLISAPVLLYFVKTLWPRQSERLPYFGNQLKRVTGHSNRA